MTNKIANYAVIPHSVTVSREDLRVYRRGIQLHDADLQSSLAPSSSFYYCSASCHVYSTSVKSLAIATNWHALTPFIGGFCRIVLNKASATFFGLALENQAYLHAGDLPPGTRVAVLTADLCTSDEFRSRLSFYTIDGNPAKRRATLTDCFRVHSTLNNLGKHNTRGLFQHTTLREVYDQSGSISTAVFAERELDYARHAFDLARCAISNDDFALNTPVFSASVGWDKIITVPEDDVNALLRDCDLLVASAGDLCRVQGTCSTSWAYLGSCSSPAFSEVLGEIAYRTSKDCSLVFFSPEVETGSLETALVSDSMRNTALGSTLSQAGVLNQTFGDLMAFSAEASSLPTGGHLASAIDFACAAYPGLLLTRSLTAQENPLTAAGQGGLPALSVSDLNLAASAYAEDFL